MLLTLLQFFATKFLFLALHLENGSFPRPLTAREELATFAALRTGDPAAREKLIRHNLRLVAHIVKKYYALPADQDDLISRGILSNPSLHPAGAACRTAHHFGSTDVLPYVPFLLRNHQSIRPYALVPIPSRPAAERRCRHGRHGRMALPGP